jgi:hypothetical protein
LLTWDFNNTEFLPAFVLEIIDVIFRGVLHIVSTESGTLDVPFPPVYCP